MRALKASPVSSKAAGKSARPAPPQLRTGESPERAEVAVAPVVPQVLKKSATGARNSAMASRTTAKASRLLAMIVREAVTTTASRRFDPMTAPRPLRAAMRPRSLTMPARRETPSPAGPMQATLALRPWRSFSAFSASRAGVPQRSAASRTST